MNLGLSGRLTRATIRSPLTPLFLLAALAAGLVALLTIPREEEPQISVPMVDIIVQANGLKAPDAVELVTKPLEAIVKAIAGVEHVYSQTQDDQAVVTARFVVGTNEDDAVLRVHDKIRANFDKIPIGIPEPLIVGRGINDVAVVVLTLSPKPAAAARWTDKDLYDLAGEAAHRAGQGGRYRHQLHRRHRSGGNPGRAGPGKAVAVRRDAAAARRQGARRQPRIRRRHRARRRHDAHAWPPARRCAACPISACCCSPRATAGRSMCATWRKVVIGPSTVDDRVWNLTPAATAGTGTACPR